MLGRSSPGVRAAIANANAAKNRRMPLQWVALYAVRQLANFNLKLDFKVEETRNCFQQPLQIALHHAHRVVFLLRVRCGVAKLHGLHQAAGDLVRCGPRLGADVRLLRDPPPLPPLAARTGIFPPRLRTRPRTT